MSSSFNADQNSSAPPCIEWTENEQNFSAPWRSKSALPAPKRVVIADDRLTADSAYRLACEGTALLWRGDFQNARQLLQAMARRADRKQRAPATTPIDAFNQHRQVQSQRARILAMLLLQFGPGHQLDLRRAPDVSAACNDAYGYDEIGYVASLRELLGVIGSHEWRKNGIEIAALKERIFPHYGVFAPIRNEYVALVAQAPLNKVRVAFDIGTGTGVLAAVLARRGVSQIIGTDQDQRALACARQTVAHLALQEQITIIEADLFPEGRAQLIVCNPPWLPARPSSPLEFAVYDPGSAMLRGFLQGLAAHLTPGGEGWLILSDLAEHLGLRSRAELRAWIQAAGLTVIDRTDVRPTHPKAADANDPLHQARAAEITSLWRLGVASENGIGLVPTDGREVK